MSRKNLKTRERILISAWKLLEDGKGRAVRMSDIAKEASVSRQAIYLHFPNRAELLIATTRYIDEVKKVDELLEKSRSAATGLERLDAFIHAWGNYIPEIYGVAKALLAMKESDLEAKLAWQDRMQAVREGCEAAVVAMKKDAVLSPKLTVKQATDLLWTLMSVRNWEQLTIECEWSQSNYLKIIKSTARRTLVVNDL